MVSVPDRRETALQPVTFPLGSERLTRLNSSSNSFVHFTCINDLIYFVFCHDLIAGITSACNSSWTVWWTSADASASLISAFQAAVDEPNSGARKEKERRSKVSLSSSTFSHISPRIRTIASTSPWAFWKTLSPTPPVRWPYWADPSLICFRHRSVWRRDGIYRSRDGEAQQTDNLVRRKSACLTYFPERIGLWQVKIRFGIGFVASSCLHDGIRNQVRTEIARKTI